MEKNRITKVYTKSGDKGQTSLVGGEKVSKSSYRVESYGETDELNSVLGLVLCWSEDQEIKQLVKKIQNDLFILGGDLATRTGSKYDVPRIRKEMYIFLENQIDKYTAEVGNLKEFILPGGTPPGAGFHIARTVCRRAERSVVSLMENEEINSNVLIYLNRLSDLLFVLARVENMRNGVEEVYVDFEAG